LLANNILHYIKVKKGKVKFFWGEFVNRIIVKRGIGTKNRKNRTDKSERKRWIPAFAGMTNSGDALVKKLTTTKYGIRNMEEHRCKHGWAQRGKAKTRFFTSFRMTNRRNRRKNRD